MEISLPEDSRFKSQWKENCMEINNRTMGECKQSLIYFLWFIQCSGEIRSSFVVNIWMVTHWCKVMDGMNENNYNILFQEMCWILHSPVLNFGVMFENIRCQLVEMIIPQKISYKCIRHGFKMSSIMTDLKAHNTGNSNVQSMWLVMALWKVKQCTNGKVLTMCLSCEICHLSLHNIRNVITIYYALDLRNYTWI